MIKVKFIRLLPVFFLLASAAHAQQFGGNAPAVKWWQINTPKARIIFPKGLDSQANRIAAVMQMLDTATAYSIGGPQRKWNVILQNQTTVPNAYVRMAPKMSELYMTPPQDNFSTGSLRWDDNLIIHENRHIQQFSNFNKGFTKVFSFFLGQEGQLFANGLFLPDYFFEGDAVWQETLVSQQGRGRMPSFYNTFKSLWAADKNYPWMKYRSGSLKDLVPDHYQIGYLLVAYGYEKYGPDFWAKVTEDAVRLKAFFNKAIERHSGIPFKQFREDAIRYFKDQAVTTPAAPFNFITPVHKGNVIDYEFPHFLSDGSIVVSKKSFSQVPAFYRIVNGREEKITGKKQCLDEYFSCNDNSIVYASFQSDPRWTNRDYSVINIVDIHSKKQKQLTIRSKYFSPDINKEGTQILVVKTGTDGSNQLVILDAATGNEIQTIPNKRNYFFTYPKFLNDKECIATARNPEGNMSLVKISNETGKIDLLTVFSYNVMGYPSIKGDTVYFSRMDGQADKLFAVDLISKRTFRITDNSNGIYAPAVNDNGELIYSAYTASGMRLVKSDIKSLLSQKRAADQLITANDLFTEKGLKYQGKRVLQDLQPRPFTATPYRKGLHLFNFHSLRPVAEDPEYGYSIFSDNVMSSLSSILTYTYNRTDRSHKLGVDALFGGWFPYLNLGAEESFNRTVDTAIGKSFQFNSATIKGGFSVPLSFTGGRTNKFLNLGAGYNVEQYYYRGVSKNIFSNKAIDYVNAFFSFSNVSRRALQHINPRWAQAVSLNYRDAFTYSNSHKLTGAASLYFPGLVRNHSLVLHAAIQKRDTLPDLFSKSFSYARGYEALSTRKMYKLGASYHFPLLYPDGGIPGLLYFQRIRASLFYDYNNATARVNGVLTDIINRSTGTEIYFDTKVWNSLPVTIGVRYARLLDTDLLNPGVKNRWEIILPVGLIPD
ncbi:MAG: hypothetical protein U0V75_06300 [Ferruginibacter sp.]